MWRMIKKDRQCMQSVILCCVRITIVLMEAQIYVPLCCSPTYTAVNNVINNC